MYSIKQGIGISILILAALIFGIRLVSAADWVNYYTFDDASGTDSAGLNSGVVTGALPVPGKINGALQFDGVDDKVTISSFATLDGQSAASISLWIKPDASGVGILSKWGTGRLISFGLLGTTYRVNWRYGGSGGGGTTLDIIAGTAKIGVWQHVVIIFNNGVATTYVDGQLAGTMSGSAGALNTGVTDAMQIGYTSVSPYFKGAFDDIRVYNKALTAQEVTDLYTQSGGTQTGGGGTTPTPVNGLCSTTVNQCTAGTLSDQTDTSTNNLWQCVGSNGGTTASCSSAITQTQPPATPGTKTVKQDGTGNYTTIQACADAAVPGDTCLVYPGTYAETVKTMNGGTGENTRITFKANGLVTVKGFDIRNPFITIDGFDISGATQQWWGHVNVLSGGSNCIIQNNTIRDALTNVGGITFVTSQGASANNCIVRGNTLRNLQYIFLYIQGGANHLIENNTLSRLNSRDYLYLFGHDHVVRRNIFKEGNAIAGVGNHPDWIQTFGDNNGESYNMLIEENWVENLDVNVQLGQVNNGNLKTALDPDIRDWVMRRNVFVNIGNNFNMGIPGLIWENNTFYKLAVSQSGIGGGGNLIRGETSRGVFMNNVFLGGGTRPNTIDDTNGYYAIQGAALWRDVVGNLITGEGPVGGPLTTTILDSLVNNGYVNVNGFIQDKARALTDISQFVFTSPYTQYKTATYDALKKTIELDTKIRTTLAADHNYVAGDAPNFYPKRSDNCTTGIFTPFRFCEPNGVNGGDPKLANLSDPDGPDNIPFTLDDGMKPLPGSQLCGKGYRGTDIGAYSCSTGIVYAASSGALVPPLGTGPTTPPAPAPSGKVGDFNNDGLVNSLDLSLLTAQWNKNVTTYDLNKDGIINTLDYTIMVKNWSL